MVYGVIYVNTTCLNLSEALSECETTDLNPRLRSLRSLSLGLLPRLRSLRSLSLGLLRVCLSEALGVIPYLLIWMRSLHGNLFHPM